MENAEELSPTALLEKLSKGEIKYMALRYSDRLSLVGMLLHDHTQEETAGILGCSRSAVVRCQNVLRDNATNLVKEVSIDRVAGRLISRAHWLSVKAARIRQYAVAWQIERELIQDLQSLGYVHREPQKHQHEHTLKREELKDDELVARLRSRGSESIN